MQKVALKELVAYLDAYLDIAHIPDYSGAFNGLQAEGRTEIGRVAVAVDACLYSIEKAIEANADLLLVHHGLFWGAQAPLTGTYYRRIERLVSHRLPVYSAHLPLDAHPEVGNNAVLLRKLGLEPQGGFLDYKGVFVGAYSDTEMPRSDLLEKLTKVLGQAPFVIATGSETVRRVGVATGGAGSLIAEAARSGVDTFITGEGAHHTYFEAEERGMNVIYGGHYATETFGVRALADHLTAQFRLETLFIDHPTGL